MRRFLERVLRVVPSALREFLGLGALLRPIALAHHPAVVTTPLITIDRRLADTVDGLTFGPPVTHVYNPLIYARGSHELYLRRFGGGRKQALFLGMNPGPFGMAQTGVPFGDVELIRTWMGVSAPVGKPPKEHPKRPVDGFACARSEVSGRRFWGWAKARFETPERFFARFFTVNYCPLVFMEGATGKNRLPEQLAPREREPLFAACDQALREVVEALQPELVIGVGFWAHGRAKVALEGVPVRLGQILHPSPASPAANRGWASQAEAQLAALGIGF